MPRKTNKQDSPEDRTNSELLDKIRKRSSIGAVLDLFNIEYQATNDTSGFKTYFCDCGVCKTTMKRSVAYFAWLDEWSCVGSRRKCGNKLYAKHLIGLILMSLESKGKKISTGDIRRKINCHLAELEKENLRIKQEFAKREKQMGIYRVNGGTNEKK